MDEPYNPSSGFSKRDLAYLLYKRKAQILAVLAVSLLLTTAAAYFKSRTFEAYASIYIERGAPQVASGAQQAPRVVLDRKEILNSEIDFMLSRAVIGKAADELLKPAPGAPGKVRAEPGLVLRSLKAAATTLRATLIASGLIDDVGTREGLIDALQGSIEAKPALNSNIITVTFGDSSPGNAARVVNTITRIYLDERLRLVKRPGIYDFYQAQIEISGTRLRKLEQQARALKSSSDVVAGEEEIRLKLEEVRDLDTDLNRARAAREELRHKIAMLQAQLSEMPEVITLATTLGRNPELTDLTRKLGVLRERRAHEIQVYRAESQKILNLDHSIAALESQLAEVSPTITQSETIAANDMRRGLESTLRQTEVEFRSVTAREDVLTRQIQSMREDLQRIDAHTAELNTVITALQNAEKTYLRYVEQQEEARISDATNVSMTNVDVIHYAAVPERPTRPRIIDILLGAALGLFMGVALAFAAEFFDHSLENKEDVESALGLPLLASLPELSSARNPLLGIFARGQRRT